MKFIFFFVLIVLGSNISPVHEIFSLFGDSNHFKYSNDNGEFTFVEFKGRDTAMMNRWLTAYKQQSKDTVLYRLFSKNPFAFWRIKSYFIDPKYNLPYKNWEEIEKTRGTITDLARFQNF